MRGWEHDDYLDALDSFSDTPPLDDVVAGALGAKQKSGDGIRSLRTAGDRAKWLESAGGVRPKEG